MTALLTDEEKVKARHHLGYLNVQEAQTFFLGIPAGVQTQFMIEGAFDRVLPAAIPEFRRLLDVLDRIEEQAIGDLELLAIDQIDEIKINPKEHPRLWREYARWARALANLMGIIPNPYDQRWATGGGINTSVVH